jgi:hypothetical protein
MSNRPAAAEVAKIDTHITHVIVSSASADGLNVFLDGKAVLQGTIESLSVEIVAPTDTSPSGTIAAVLARFETTSDGQKRQVGTNLFPGTVEVIADGKRVTVSCAETGSFEGLYLGLGMRADGTSDGLTGVQSLRVAVAPGGLISAKLLWSDGLEEAIF